MATTRAGAALPPTSRSGKQLTTKPVLGSAPRLNRPLDLRVGQVGLVGGPEDARLAALERLLRLEVQRPSQPHASMPMTRTPLLVEPARRLGGHAGPRIM
jgi:hypothetical protein